MKQVERPEYSHVPPPSSPLRVSGLDFLPFADEGLSALSTRESDLFQPICCRLADVEASK
jgi:hypothetical protein